MTEEEAAHYCCVSYSQFRKRVAVTWSTTHQDKALVEGWGLFWVIDNGKPIKTARQMILPATGRFKHRLEATNFVVAAAKQRSELHILALQVCAASAVPRR